jgi:hypothetical protein
VQDDTLHGELVRIADAQERVAKALEIISGHTRFIGAGGP